MSEMGKYIYGIVSSDKELFFTSCKVIAGSDVYTIHYRDIAAVVSDKEVVDYNHLPKDNVARYLISHQLVIERVMEDFTIIPMRLGTYALDEDEVRYTLVKGYPMIKDIFERTHGKIEIDVVVTWSDFNGVLKEVAEEEEIREFKQILLGKKEGVTVDDQMKIGVLVKNHLYQKRERYAKEIGTSLAIISRNHKAHDLMNDEMVLNMAFLIEKSRKEDFEKMVEDLNTKFGEKLNFRCVGPLPLYSFNTLEVKKIQFNEIALAKEKLNLRDIATKEEIKKAYRRQALVYHPDRTHRISDTEGQFEEVNRAYKLLLECCQEGVCSFKEEFARDAIVVKIRD